MQSNWARLALVAAAVAVAVALFVVLNDGDDEPTGTSAPNEIAGEDGATGGGDSGEAEVKEPTKPEIPTIEVKGGQPVGGVQELSFQSGDQIRFRVDSDVAEHVHVHGYDVIRDVAPGKPVEFDFPADIEGLFEVELEDSHTQIAELSVKPG
jgi:hypothetical protein